MDYHGTLEAYAAAKAMLFQFASLKVAIINLDDEYAVVHVASGAQNPAQPKILTYSTQQAADYQVQQIEYSLNGVRFQLKNCYGRICGAKSVARTF